MDERNVQKWSRFQNAFMILSTITADDATRNVTPLFTIPSENIYHYAEIVYI